MSAWGKSDNKSSSGEVALSAPSITFNAATGHAAGVYTSAGHPFQLGDPVAYANGGGTSVVGLTSGSTYYVTNVTANTFMLASTEDRALRNVPEVITSTDGIGASHTFTLPLALGRGTLTGTETEFETELLVGDIVRASATGGNQEMIVIAVTSDTLATVINANPGTTLTAFSNDEDYRIHEKPTSVASVATTDFESTQVFGVRSSEIHGDQEGGYVSAVSLQTAGVAKYVEVPAVTFSGGGGADAEATAVITAGAVSTITVTDNGESYETAPTVTVARPTISFNGETNPTLATNVINYTGHLFVTGDAVTYNPNGSGRMRGDVVTVDGTSGAGNINTTTNVITATGHPFLSGDEVYYEKSGLTAIVGLTTDTSYFIRKISANEFALYDTYANSIAVGSTGLMDITGNGSGEEDTFKYIFNTNQTYYVIKASNDTLKLARTAALATAGTAIDLSATFGPNVEPGTQLTLTTGAPVFKAALGVNQGIDEAESGAVAHTGWVHRKVLTGRHAGRIQYEVLVALSKNGITSDAGDDIEFPED